MPKGSQDEKRPFIRRVLAPAVVAGAVIAGLVSAVFAHADKGSSGWKDPYPVMPIHDDPAFVGTGWHPGPMVGGSVLEYMAQVPDGDTTAMPAIVAGGAGEHSLVTHTFYGKAVVVFIGPSPTTRYSGGPVHNSWLLDELTNGTGPNCSPVCPAWMFVPAAAIRDVLADVARHVRFAHDRVQMFGNINTRYDIYRALDPILQPYFAGVAYAVYAEWQQATCPDVARPTASPPRIFFSWGGCDDSFCPTIDCMNTLKTYGYTIDPSSKGDTTPAKCPCAGRAPAHVLPAGAETLKATYDWLLANVRR